MECEEEDNRICRICMQSDPILDWHEELFDFRGMTYKDCYYKYTQLEEIVSDTFPQFLCGACSTDLQSFHLLIEKAIETQKLFEQNLDTADYECVDIKIRTSLDSRTETVHETEYLYKSVRPLLDSVEPDPETEYVYKTDRSSLDSVEPDHETECVYLMENDDDDSLQALADESWGISEEELIQIEPRSSRRMNQTTKTEKILGEGACILARKSARMERGPEKDEKAKERLKVQPAAEIPDEEKINNAKTKRNTPVMCSYCSKIIHNVYYLKKHEQTHKEDRAREKSCPKCGLKTFTSAGLYNHMKIHEKNREKKHKCEFCDKAFFDRGACNIHRRIHLGQMVKCPICPKEYFRQVDLDKHMASHSHAPIHSAKPKSKVKYVVHCKECNKQICSAKFNAHRAAHLNDPLMRCTVCEKDFFCRKSCTRHMQRVHKKTKDNYDDITAYYEKYRPRLSRILREQQEEVKTEIL